jgi:hypothetical protein
VKIRKAGCTTDEVRLERGESVSFPTVRAVAVAVIENPWLGHASPTESLQAEVEAVAPDLALLLTDYLLEALGRPDGVQTFGKGAIVGLDGELEHAAALLHTPYFGNLLRERLAGTEYISWSDVRGTPGTLLVIPTINKTRGGLRSHFVTVPVSVADAPRADEIVVIAAAASGPRPNARIGDRTTDRKVRLAEYADHPLVAGRS